MFVSESCALADLAFALDASGSVGDEHWQKSLEFVDAVVKRVDISPMHTLVSVLTFGTFARIQVIFIFLQYFCIIYGFLLSVKFP